MFTMAPKRRGLFGNGQTTLPGPISGYGGGTWNVDGTQATPVQRHNYAQDGNARKRGDSFFDRQFFGDVLGNFGDYLLQNGGMAPIYAPAMKARRNAAAEALEREAEFADWQRKQQWKRDNPAPISNDTANDYAFWQSKLTPEQFEQWKANKINPPVWRQGADGQFYRMDTGGGNDAPDTLPADFDFGGPSQPATGGFPRR